MGVLENLPLRRVTMQLLFLFVGFAVGLEVDCRSEIFRPGEHMGNSTISPYVISGKFPIIRNRSSVVLGIRRRIHDVPLCDLLCNL